ncbi:MAG TPA: sialidase [Cyanothece sp. UBA12306]|nr:sialidase [Cyanothece sp. UBA12306]
MKLNKLISLIVRICLIFILSISGLFIGIPVANAHRPHDVIKQMEISPNYEQDQTIYIIVREKFLKSEDGGKSWYKLFRGLDNNFDFSSFSIALSNSQILYISAPGDGIYRSQDGGLSWNKKNQGLEEAKITLLSVSLHSPDVVLASDKEGGLYLTNDGGNTWRSVISEAQITAISFAASDDKIMAVGDSLGNIYLSSDQGLTWTKIIKMDRHEKVQAIALSPTFTQDNTFWIGTEKGGVWKTTDSGNSLTQVNKGLSDLKIRSLVPSPNYSQDSILFVSTWDQGVFQSIDQGNSWKKVSKGLTKNSQADEDKFSEPHFQDLRISQNFVQDKTIFLGGFDGLFSSNNGGQNWQEIETLSTRIITSLAVSPNYKNDSTLAIGTYEKEAYITRDKGITWEPIVRGFAAPSYKANSNPSIKIEYSRFYDLIFSPNYEQDNTLFASFLYKFFKSTNQGKFWQQMHLFSKERGILRDTYMVASPDFANDKTLYIITKNGGFIYSSQDKGETFSVIHKLKNSTKSVVISPNFAKDKTIFISGFDRLYKTIDGGKNWEIISNDIPLDNVIWLQLAISPNYQQDQTVFAGTNQGIFKTNNGGKTWQQLKGSFLIKQTIIEAMAISPNYQNDHTIIASVRGLGLVKSTDSGKTFEEIGGDFNHKHFLGEMVMSGSSPIHFSPNYAEDQTIYGFGSSTANLYKSTDGGWNWEVIFIPQKSDLIANLLTQLKVTKIFFNIYPSLRFLLALIIALSAYPLVGLLKLEKKLPFNSFQVKFGTTVSLFLLIVITLSLI